MGRYRHHHHRRSRRTAQSTTPSTSGENIAAPQFGLPYNNILAPPTHSAFTVLPLPGPMETDLLSGMPYPIAEAIVSNCVHLEDLMSLYWTSRILRSAVISRLSKVRTICIGRHYDAPFSHSIVVTPNGHRQLTSQQGHWLREHLRLPIERLCVRYYSTRSFSEVYEVFRSQTHLGLAGVWENVSAIEFVHYNMDNYESMIPPQLHLDLIGAVQTLGVDYYRYTLPNSPAVDGVVGLLRPIFWHMMELPACRCIEIVAPRLTQTYDFADLPKALMQQIFFTAEQWCTFTTVDRITLRVVTTDPILPSLHMFCTEFIETEVKKRVASPTSPKLLYAWKEDRSAISVFTEGAEKVITFEI